MEITLLSRLDVKPSENELFYRLKEVDEFKKYSDTKLHLLVTYLNPNIENILFSFILQLNELGKTETILVDGKYKFKFSFSSYVKIKSSFSSSPKDDLKGGSKDDLKYSITEFINKKNTNTEDYETETIISPNTMVDVSGIIFDNYRFDFKNEKHMKALVYNLVVYKQYFRTTPSQFKPKDNVKQPVFEPLIKHEYFGYGELNDYITLKNFNMYNLTKKFDPYIFENKLKFVGRKRINYKNIFMNMLFEKIKGYKTNDENEKQRLYRSYRNKALKTKSFESDKIEIDYGLNFDEIYRRAFTLYEGEDITISSDLFNRTKQIINDLFILNDEYLMKRFIDEVIRVAFPVIKSLFSTAGNTNELSLIKDMYIVAILHFIYDSNNINLQLKLTNSKNKKEIFNQFVNFIKKRHKHYIQQQQLSTTILEKEYYNIAIKASKKVNEIYHIPLSETVIRHFDKYIFRTNLIHNAITTNVSLKKLYNKNQTNDSLLGKDLEYDQFKIQYESRIFNTGSEKINRNIFPLTISWKKKPLYLFNVEMKLKFYDDYFIDRFYKFYANYCPKKTSHTFENEKCIHCGITKKQIETYDKTFFNRYKTNFELLDEKPKVIYYQKKSNPTIPVKKNTNNELINKISFVSSKFKLNKFQLLNLTKTNGKKINEIKQRIFDEKITKYHVHKIKFYYGMIKGGDLNILNMDDLNQVFNMIYIKLLEQAKKNQLEEILDIDKKYCYIDFAKEIRTKKITIEIEEEEEVNNDGLNNIDLHEVQEDIYDIDYDGSNEEF